MNKVSKNTGLYFLNPKFIYQLLKKSGLSLLYYLFCIVFGLVIGVLIGIILLMNIYIGR